MNETYTYWDVRKQAKHIIYKFPGINQEELKRIVSGKTKTLDKVLRHLEKAGEIKETTQNRDRQYYGRNWAKQLLYYWFFTS